MAQAKRTGNYSGSKVGRKWTLKVHKRCAYCGENMVTTEYKIRKGLGKYCSKPCANAARTGTPVDAARKGETRKCKTCGGEFYATPGQIKKGYGMFCSIGCSKIGVAPWNKGKPWPEKAGENNPAWRGGTAKEYELIRGSAEYKLWRQAVYARDFYTCQACGAKSDRRKGIKIHAHHILAFADFPHKRTDISNGITLCQDCHGKAHGIKEKQS